MKISKIVKLDRFDYLFIVLGILLYAVLLHVPFKVKPFGDLNFHVETKAVAQFIWGVGEWQEIVVEKAPGPDLFYFIPYILAGPDATDAIYWTVGVLWTAIFIIFSPILLRRAATAFFGKAAGIIAASLLLVFPLHIYYSLGINGEGMAFIGTIFMLYGWALWSTTYTQKIFNRYWWIFSIGALMLVLARLNVILIVPFTFLFLAVLYYKERTFSPQFIGVLAFALFVFLGTLGIRFITNQLPGNQQADKQLKYGAYVLHMGRFQFRNEPLDWRFWQDNFREGSTDYAAWVENHRILDDHLMRNPDKTYAEVYNKWVIDDYLAHPWITMRQFVVKSLFGNFFIINSIQPKQLQLGPLSGNFVFIFLHLIINVINILILLAFFVFLYMKRHQLILYWFIGVSFLSLIIFYAMVYMEPRYLFPLRAVFILAAAYPFAILYERWRYRRSSSSAKALT